MDSTNGSEISTLGRESLWIMGTCGSFLVWPSYAPPRMYTYVHIFPDASYFPTCHPSSRLATFPRLCSKHYLFASIQVHQFYHQDGGCPNSHNGRRGGNNTMGGTNRTDSHVRHSLWEGCGIETAFQRLSRSGRIRNSRLYSHQQGAYYFYHMRRHDGHFCVCGGGTDNNKEDCDGVAGNGGLHDDSGIGLFTLPGLSIYFADAL